MFIDNNKNLIGKNALKMLDSGKVINNKGASDYQQQLEMLGQSAETDKDTGYVIYTEDDNDINRNIDTCISRRIRIGFYYA